MNLLEDPEFNAELRLKPSFSIDFSVAFVCGLLGAEVREEEPEARKTLDATIDNAIKAFAVSNVRQSYVFRITATTQAPQKSALMANTLAELTSTISLELNLKRLKRPQIGSPAALRN